MYHLARYIESSEWSIVHQALNIIQCYLTPQSSPETKSDKIINDSSTNIFTSPRSSFFRSLILSGPISGVPHWDQNAFIAEGEMRVYLFMCIFIFIIIACRRHRRYHHSSLNDLPPRTPAVTLTHSLYPHTSRHTNK